MVRCSNPTVNGSSRFPFSLQYGNLTIFYLFRKTNGRNSVWENMWEYTFNFNVKALIFTSFIFGPLGVVNTTLTYYDEVDVASMLAKSCLFAILEQHRATLALI